MCFLDVFSQRDPPNVKRLLLANANPSMIGCNSNETLTGLLSSARADGHYDRSVRLSYTKKDAIAGSKRRAAKSEVEQLQAPQTQRSSLETGSAAMRAGLGVNPLSASFTATTLPWLCSEARIYTQDAERQMVVVAT